VALIILHQFSSGNYLLFYNEVKNKNMNFGLIKRDTENINSTAKQFAEIEKIIIFGSRAKGTNKKGSNVDLALKGKNISRKAVNRFRAILNIVKV
jgi:predicted nucleotidyltransferase